nr:zinc-type alcohol dehydrogenase-like protein c16a3.02c [Quercus suber]
MSSPSTPSSIRIWKYDKVSGGLETHLKLQNLPLPNPQPDQHLVQIIATSINPVDFKPAETPVVGSILVRKPATPGIDITGWVVVPAAGSPLKPGQLVFGAAARAPFAAGGLAEFAAINRDLLLPLPDGVDPIDAASVPVAGLTAYQTIVPFVKKGDHVFLNGGSGGVGVFGIQIAKAIGAHVTVTCSKRNIDLCTQLGADVVVDYTAGNVVDQLRALNYQFDHVVENVGSDHSIYWRAHEYTRPGALYMNVASSPALGDLWFASTASLLPSFLGGGKRKLKWIFAQINADDLRQLIEWMKEGTIKAVIDSKFSFEQAPEAFRRLKTGRARGKIIIEGAAALDTKTV